VREVLMRVLAALGVGVWCIFILLISVVFIVDRGLADVGIAWLGILGIGVAAPALLLWQMNRAIATHEKSRRAIPGVRDGEKELLSALEERGVLTPATAAMRTSLTVDEASQMLEDLARRGHLELQLQDGVTVYALAERDRRGLPGKAPAPPVVESGEAGASRRLEDPLSERELEVLGLLASGKTNSEVARDLFVSVGTVKSHTGNIYRKLGAKNRAEALARARDFGVLR
jgi:DNA-binding NarL/FixJ family response regulator